MRHHFTAEYKPLPRYGRWILLALAFATVPLAGAQPPAAARAAGQPQMSGPLVCDAPVYDFGERDNFTRVTHRFQLRNTGSEPLDINRVLTTCGCTVANLKQRTLAPGESVPLEVEVSFEGRTGVFEKHLFVLYGGKAQNRVQLTMKGMAVEHLRITPPTVNLSNSAMDHASESSTTIERWRGPLHSNCARSRQIAPTSS
ncbi:MAG: DUF1573 domain-containing protein [Candidatus Hydrogenedentales bacterium]